MDWKGRGYDELSTTPYPGFTYCFHLCLQMEDCLGVGDNGIECFLMIKSGIASPKSNGKITTHHGGEGIPQSGTNDDGYRCFYATTSNLILLFIF